MGIQTGSYSKNLIGWAFAALLSVATSTAGAAVLYQQAPVGGGLGYYSNPNWPQQMADDFNLGGAATLERITWWGGYGSNFDAGDDDFLVRIYSNVSGTGTVTQEFSSAAFTRTATALADAASNDVYQYDFDLNTPLASGTYHLFIQNLGTSDWFWLQGNAGNSNLVYRADDTQTWIAYNDDLAWRLEGTRAQVPEPGSLLLMLMAGFVLLVSRAMARCSASSYFR